MECCREEVDDFRRELDELRNWVQYHIIQTPGISTADGMTFLSRCTGRGRRSHHRFLDLLLLLALVVSDRHLSWAPRNHVYVSPYGREPSADTREHAIRLQ